MKVFEVKRYAVSGLIGNFTSSVLVRAKNEASAIKKATKAMLGGAALGPKDVMEVKERSDLY